MNFPPGSEMYVPQGLFLEILFQRPQPKGRIADVEDLLAVDGVEAVLQFGNIILFAHGGQVAVVEAHRLDLLPGDAGAGAVGDLEPAFAGTVDQVRRGAEALLQFGVLRHGLQGVGSAFVAVLADQPVVLLILAELLEPGGKDDEIAVIGNGHPGAVDRLVAQPGTLELLRVQIDHHLFQGGVQKFQIGLHAEAGGVFEGLFAGAGEEAPHGHFARGVVSAHDGEHIDQRHVLEEGVHAVVEEAAHRGIRVAHDGLQAGDSAEKVGLVDDVGTAHADHDVLGVVGHAHHFVGDHLPDGEYQIVILEEDLIGFDADFVVQFALGEFLNHLRGDGSQPDHVVAPVVDQKLLQRDGGAEHHLQLFFAHGAVSSEGGHDVDVAILAVPLVDEAGDLAGLRVQPGMIGGKEQHFFRRLAGFLDGGEHQLLQVVIADGVEFGSAFGVDRHDLLSFMLKGRRKDRPRPDRSGRGQDLRFQEREPYAV